MKLNPPVGGQYQTKVTPFVGVWIETGDTQPRAVDNRVTPFVGVWIETFGRMMKQRRC